MFLREHPDFQKTDLITIIQTDKPTTRFHKKVGFPKDIRGAEIKNWFGGLKIFYKNKWKECHFFHFEEDNRTTFTIFL